MSPHSSSRREINRLRRRMLLRLVAAIGVLVLIALGLAIRLGQQVWPVWLTNNRGTFVGLLALAILALIFFAPVIIEADTNPRPLRGPGHDPRHHGEG